MRHSLLAVVLACAFPAASSADPLVIATGTLFQHHGVSGPGMQFGLDGRFFMQFPWSATIPQPELFDQTLTGADVGRTLRATADNEPNFAAAASVLTNGVDDFIGYGLRFDDGLWGRSVLTETGLFGRRSGAANPDLRGFTITALTVRMDRLIVTEFPSGTRGVEFEALLEVEGTPIPEPATLALLATGLAGIARRAFRHRSPSCRGAAPRGAFHQ